MFTMRTKLTAFLLSFIFAYSVQAQSKGHFEYSANLNSGFFYFTGKNVSSLTFMSMPSQGFDSYVTNPTGNESGFSYEIAGNIKRVTKFNFLYGMDVAYQSLQSRSSVNFVSPGFMYSSVMPATGYAHLTNKFIDFAPFIGYRLPVKHFDIDVTAGIEIAPWLAAKEVAKATVTSTQAVVESNKNVSKPNTDLRTRLGLSIYYNHFGINAGYSIGKINYYNQWAGGSIEAFTRFVRLGIAYRF